MRDAAREFVRLPDEVWDNPDTQAALRERRIAVLFGLAKKYAGASQTRIANATGMDQSEISRITRGDRQIGAIDVLERVAHGLAMPDRARVLLGLAPVEQAPDATVEDSGSRAPGGRPRLPEPLTELIGREVEIAEIARLLALRRLVTLVGAPGIGKTRLALAVAAQASSGDGVLFVSLAEIQAPEDVVATVARTLGVVEVAGPPLVETLGEHLADTQLLLVLDNFEHVLDAAPDVAALVGHCAGLSVLVTSRERLRISGEQVYAVPPLTLPDLGRSRSAGATPAEVLAASSAMRLFADRAGAVAADFTLTARTLGTVAELCHRLDGLPLAIELAAARVHTFTPGELLTELSHRLSLLSEGPRDLPARQRTLQAAIAWSFDQLHAGEQALLSRLSVFAGGCLAASAHAVCAPDETDLWVTQHLSALANKNLVLVRPDPEGRTRYQLLETIRVFAAGRLAASGDEDTVRSRHAGQCAGFAARAREELAGPDQSLWVARLDREYPNLQAALSWALAHDRVETAAQLALALDRFWARGHDIGGGRRWYDRIIARSGDIAAESRMGVLICAAGLACYQFDPAPARLLADRGLAEARALGDRSMVADALNTLALIAWGAGEYEQARAWLAECLAARREQGDTRWIAHTLANLGGIAFHLADLDAAAATDAESLELYRQIGDRRGVALSLANLGEVRLWQGDASAARALLTEALSMSREIGERFIEAWVLNHLAGLAMLTADRAEALRLHAEALELSREIGDQEYVAQTLESLTALAEPDLAARFMAAATALRERLSLPVPPVYRPELDRQLARLRGELDEAAFAAAWAEGSHAQLDEVTAAALTWARSPAEPAPTPSLGA